MLKITVPAHQALLAQEIRNVGSALRELASAARQLFKALWAVFVYQRGKRQPTLSWLEEANLVRAMADDVCASDPRFAQDLYAAANRHELAGSAC